MTSMDEASHGQSRAVWQDSECPVDAVRRTCRWVLEQSSHVEMEGDAIRKLAAKLASRMSVTCEGRDAETCAADSQVPAVSLVPPRSESGDEARAATAAGSISSAGNPIAPMSWNFDGVHFNDGGPLTAQYLLVLDAINFCFWPEPGLLYCHLAEGLRASVQRDPSCIDAASLAAMTEPRLLSLLSLPPPLSLPLASERVRLLSEVGRGLQRHFGGSAFELLRQAEGSAAALVALLLRHFPGFNDGVEYRGRRVLLLKRAQIFAADVWGAYREAARDVDTRAEADGGVARMGEAERNEGHEGVATRLEQLKNEFGATAGESDLQAAATEPLQSRAACCDPSSTAGGAAAGRGTEPLYCGQQADPPLPSQPAVPPGEEGSRPAGLPAGDCPAGALSGHHHPADFSDISALTMFADYLVPAVLRYHGVLRYSAELASKVDREVVLPAGSEEEVEIRAVCVVATEELREVLHREHGVELSSVQLDWQLWAEGSEMPEIKHHRTITTFY